MAARASRIAANIAFSGNWRNGAKSARRDDTPRFDPGSLPKHGLGAAEMQIGVIGLGRMGANIVRRLQRGQHECVAYDADASVVERLAAEGMATTGSLSDFVSRLVAPRVVWVMVPAGAPTEDSISK